MKTLNFGQTKQSLKIIFLSILFTSFLVFTSCSNNDEECEIIDEDVYPRACTLGLDVTFLLDYTGSMGGVINGIKTSIPTIVNKIKNKSIGNYSLSLCIFDEYSKDSGPSYGGQPTYISLPPAQKMIITSGPTTDQHLTVLELFSYQNETSFINQLNLLNAAWPLGSGNGFAEPGCLLLEQVLPTNNFAGNWRSNITRLAIIITDATAGGDDDMANSIDDAFLFALATQANTEQVQVILITSLPASNYDSFLINNNIGGLSILNADLNNIGEEIINAIDQLCFNNAQQ